ncbi:MAG: CPBP family intramembrane metalloprotease [Methanosarcinaceae archaeon]|nr:CPBP family intramembrane metalloprotease [Methanosarcinaceae archaeon]
MKNYFTGIFTGIRGLIGVPITGIAFAELLIYSGKIKEAIFLHAIILIALSLSATVMKDEQVQKSYQALLLLPILRLVNLSMPTFFDMALYSFVFIYAPLAIPVAIAAMNQKMNRKELGLTFDKKLWLYISLAIPLSFLLGYGEYSTIRTGYLIPDLSLLNLLKLTVVMVFFVGFIEEILFRAMLQTRLSEAFGTLKGILLASFLFGIMHSGYGTPYEILYTSFVGFIIGIIFYKTQSLPFVTILHGLVNVFLFGVIPHMGLS